MLIDKLILFFRVVIFCLPYHQCWRGWKKFQRKKNIRCQLIFNSCKIFLIYKGELRILFLKWITSDVQINFNQKHQMLYLSSSHALWACFGFPHCPGRQFCRIRQCWPSNQIAQMQSTLLQVNSTLRSLIVYLNQYF